MVLWGEWSSVDQCLSRACLVFHEHGVSIKLLYLHGETHAHTHFLSSMVFSPYLFYEWFSMQKDSLYSYISYWPVCCLLRVRHCIFCMRACVPHFRWLCVCVCELYFLFELVYLCVLFAHLRH